MYLFIKRCLDIILSLFGVVLWVLLSNWYIYQWEMEVTSCIHIKE